VIDLAAFDLSDHDATLEAVWALLVDGVVDRRSAAHTPSLATVALGDGGARSRIVVLRAVDREARTVRFHTDLRSSKMMEIERDPQVSLLIYDAPAKLQVRLEGRAVPHHAGSVADEAWASSRPSARVCYGVSPPPGMLIRGPDDFSTPQGEEAIAAGRENFAAVVVELERIETLWLRHEGHRRALFTWAGTERHDPLWLTP
jgi:pyridoxamine 5'-phosphate oxidase